MLPARFGGFAGRVVRLSVLLAIFGSALWGGQSACAQNASAAPEQRAVIEGVVLNAQAAPVVGAVVSLRAADGSVRRTTTNRDGKFVFAAIRRRDFRLSAEKDGLSSGIVSVAAQPLEKPQTVRLRLPAMPQAAEASAQRPAMKFSDQPSFRIAGVTDWTAVGGHGSDANLRTSEALARDTMTLQPVEPNGAVPNAAQASGAERQMEAALAAAPGSFAPNHQLGELYLQTGRYRRALPLLESAWRIDPRNDGNTWDLALACRGVGDYSQARAHVTELLAHGANANAYRLAGDLDEQMGHPLSAVHDYQLALQADPSEQNYFSLGSDLLLHRAVWQAQAVFSKGASAYPRSARMQTGLGAALFAGALYDRAAEQLCAASDLAPSDPEPYLFMGKIEIASPDPLPCVQSRLDRFLREKPSDTRADFLDAMAILKAQERSPDPAAVQRATSLLQKAVAVDAENGQAWLELGNLSATQHNDAAAIQLYRRAIAADPQLSEAYYRLGVAYDRTGERALAQEQFRLHDQIAKSQAAAIDRQRSRIQQFLIVQDGAQPAQPIH